MVFICLTLHLFMWYAQFQRCQFFAGIKLKTVNINPHGFEANLGNLAKNIPKYSIWHFNEKISLQGSEPLNLKKDLLQYSL